MLVLGVFLWTVMIVQLFRVKLSLGGLVLYLVGGYLCLGYSAGTFT